MPKFTREQKDLLIELSKLAPTASSASTAIMIVLEGIVNGIKYNEKEPTNEYIKLVMADIEAGEQAMKRTKEILSVLLKNNKESK